MSGSDEWTGLRAFFTRRANDASGDAQATGYVASTDAPSSAAIYRAIAEDIGPLLALEPSDTLLDIGCGTGALLVLLAPKVARARGIDITPAMVELATAKGLAVDQGDGGPLPYPDGSFSAVVMFFVTINISDRALLVALIGEGLRVVAPGGRLLVGANPHPVESGFRPTPSGIEARLRRLVQSRAGRIGAYAIDYGVFAEAASHYPGTEARFVRAMPTHPAGRGKYHVLLSKSRADDPRAYPQRPTP